MDYSMQGSKDSYSPQVHNLYPHAQPGLYPPPPAPSPANPQGGYQHQYYQDYAGGAEQPPCSYGHSTWPGPQAAPSDEAGPFYYHDDADCITFLRGCLAGLCCCWLLEGCCL